MQESNGARVGAEATMAAATSPPRIPYPCRLLSYFVYLSLSIYISTYLYIYLFSHTSAHTHTRTPTEAAKAASTTTRTLSSFSRTLFLSIYLSIIYISVIYLSTTLSIYYLLSLSLSLWL